MCFVAKDSKFQPAAYDAAVRHGVADCTLEARFMQETAGREAVVSGTSILQRAKLQNRPTVVAGPKDAEKLRQAGLDEADIAWIGANELPASRLIVAKPDDGPAAWWSVRADGNCILRTSGGRGSGDTDYALLIMKVAGWGLCVLDMRHAAHEPSNASGWGLVSCLVLSGVSGGFMMAGIHGTAGWLLVFFEMANWAITKSVEADH